MQKFSIPMCLEITCIYSQVFITLLKSIISFQQMLTSNFDIKSDDDFIRLTRVQKQKQQNHATS